MSQVQSARSRGPSAAQTSANRIAADRAALLLMAERYERRAAEAATSPALFPGRLSLEKPGAVSAGRTGGSFILTEAVEAA